MYPAMGISPGPSSGRKSTRRLPLASGWLSTRASKLKARPDANYIGKMVQRGFMRKGAEELQQRLLGKERSASPGEPAPQETPSDQDKDKKKNSTEELIRKGLDQLFKR